MIKRGIIILTLMFCIPAVFAEVYQSLSREKQLDLINDVSLAAAAYGDHSVPQGYRVATQEEYQKYIGTVSGVEYKDGLFHSDKSDLDGRLLVNESDGSLVLAFAGTDSWYDVNIDIEQAFGGIPIQYNDAATMLKQILQNTDSSMQIKVVGHSLGGGTATYATLSNPSDRVTTTTVNPAGLTWSTTISAGFGKGIYSITNVIDGGDPVSKYGITWGTTYKIHNEDLFAGPPEHDSWWKSILAAVSGYDASYAAVATFVESLLSHKVDTVLTDMRLNLNPTSTDNKKSGNSSSDDRDDSNSDGSTDGDMCRSGDDESAADGDMCYPEDDTEATVSGKDDNVSYPQDNQNSSDGNDSVGESVLEKIGGAVDSAADNLGVVLPTIPHYRVLWMFSGESLVNCGKSALSNVKDLLSSGSFSEIFGNFKDEVGFKDLESAIGRIKGDGE